MRKERKRMVVELKSENQLEFARLLYDICEMVSETPDAIKIVKDYPEGDSIFMKVVNEGERI